MIQSRGVVVAAVAVALGHGVAAMADVPLQIYNLPSLQGQGQVTIRSALDQHEIFVNGFNGLNFGSSTFDPNDPRILRVSRTGTTGGGIGGGPPPARVTTQAIVETTAALLDSIHISGSVSSFGFCSSIGPDELPGLSGGGTVEMYFTISEPVFAQWSGGVGTSLRRNNVPILLNPISIILLLPGNYVASATASGFATGPAGSTPSFSAGNRFDLTVGTPAPSGVATLGLAGLLVRRRRR